MTVTFHFINSSLWKKLVGAAKYGNQHKGNQRAIFRLYDSVPV